jgi:dihydrofolate synthase/folylpolyglutamate synthase
LWNFEQAEQYVASLLKFGINLGLERVEDYLNKSGYPWGSIKFIHVGGTNGKGSTAAMIAGILTHAGYRVGLYTSPHINNYCDRISIDGQNIRPGQFAELAEEIAGETEGVSRDARLTEFEFLTVLAFKFFNREGVDAAVIEVGMGGRFDATNVIPAPELSVITNISKDHTQYLGYSELDIAGEKAGIIKPNGCLVTAEQSPEIRSMFWRKCCELGSDFFVVGDEITWRQGPMVFSKEGIVQECCLKGSLFELNSLGLPLIGQHQIINACTALLGAQVLREKGLSISQQDVRWGLENANLPGRIEVLNRKPLVILDAAHNTAGISALRDTIFRIAGEGRLILVTGVLDDKEQDRIAALWGDFPSRVIVTRPENADRSRSWEQLAHYFSRYLDSVCLIESIDEAVACGWDFTGNEDVLCVSGSFYLLKRSRHKLHALIEKI